MSYFKRAGILVRLKLQYLRKHSFVYELGVSLSYCKRRKAKIFFFRSHSVSHDPFHVYFMYIGYGTDMCTLHQKIDIRNKLARLCHVIFWLRMLRRETKRAYLKRIHKLEVLNGNFELKLALFFLRGKMDSVVKTEFCNFKLFLYLCLLNKIAP